MIRHMNLRSTLLHFFLARLALRLSACRLSRPTFRMGLMLRPADRSIRKDPTSSPSAYVSTEAGTTHESSCRVVMVTTSLTRMVI